MSTASPAPGDRRLPRGVFALGLVSLCMDASSELVHSLLPMFLVGVLGASAVTVGLLEGVAEATAALTKVFSGALSDRWRRRKGLVVAGYGLAALTKPVFPLAESVAWVFAARFLDRVGKGIRGAPRDALIADLTPLAQRSAAYGLRQSMDSVGAFIGPVLAIGLLLLWQDDLRAAMWVAVIPAALAVLLLLFAVREAPAAAGSADAGGPVRPPRTRLFAVGGLGTRYWLVVGIGGVLTLARFSEAFLILRARDTGLPVTWVPAVLVLMNVVYAASAYPVGLAAARWSRRKLIALGIALLLAADLALAAAHSPLLVFVGTGLWGLHMGCTQGLLSALVSEAAPPARTGTAFGFFNFVTGLLLLVASALAGLLWQYAGARTTFLAGAAFSAVALAGILLARPPGPAA